MKINRKRFDASYCAAGRLKSGISTQNECGKNGKRKPFYATRDIAYRLHGSNGNDFIWWNTAKSYWQLIGTN